MLMRDFDHIAVDAKWQQYWEENGTYRCEVDSTKPKYYALDMFPYPSGAGLHVGHTVGYTATDVVSRYRRMRGYNVLHPMGWDSFGLPAERYAVRTGQHPAVTTQQNVNAFRKQLKSLGFSYDWSREIATSDPEYYKWTQWIFTKLYEKGLAYEAEAPVNFCPALGTVLANEDVVNGRSAEGDHEVIRMPLKQWLLKITSYADRLLDDLQLVDWPESIKALQRNWIGRSEGVTVHFSIPGHRQKISVYTTRIDTIFGVSFLVLAPEHQSVKKLTTEEQRTDVEAYIEKAKQKTEFERTEVALLRSGVFTGGYVRHPITGLKIPVWVADYVLPTYGTGAVMGVPAHDARDHEFASHHHLPILEVIRPIPPQESKKSEAFEGEGILVNSTWKDLSFDGVSSQEARQRIADWFVEQNHGKRSVHYKLRDWLFSRQRYWGEPIPILHFPDGTKRTLDIDELPLLPPYLEDFSPPGDGTSALAKVPAWIDIIDPKTGRLAKRESNTMPQWAGSCWYYLRFCDPHNDTAAWDPQIERYWMPVDLYVGGAEHAVLHLLYARFWHKVLFDCGLVTHPEPFQALRNQGLVVARTFKDSQQRYVDVGDVTEDKGVYLHKKTGEKLTCQIEKMSKSKLNGVPPDEAIAEFGADAFRLAVSFMGPLEKEKVWNNDALYGCRRFLSRVFDMVTSDKVSDHEDEEADKLINRLLAKTHADMQTLHLNTVVAKMMEFVNEMSGRQHYSKSALQTFVQILSMYAPHICEEMWRVLGNKDSVVRSRLPDADQRYLVDEMATYVIQVDGKVRGRLELLKDLPQEDVEKLALEHSNVTRFVTKDKIKKTIVVPNKLISFVTTT